MTSEYAIKPPKGDLSQSANSFAVRLRQISKSFGLVKANQDINLDVPSGSIHGIIGENGAGKSTLMNILYGFYQADDGSIEINGAPVKMRSTFDAISKGVGMVHQHFMLVPRFSVLENILLGSEGGFTLKQGQQRVREIVAGLGEDLSRGLDLEAAVEDLSVGMQQRVEIIKALKEGANILILDEPTGVLTPQEAEMLFEILRSLKARGATILLITHKLKEIMAITDNVSVMRHGEMIAHRKTDETSSEELAQLMVGRKVLLNVKKKASQLGDVLLNVNDIGLTSKEGVDRLSNINFHIQAGEVLGIAGVAGNGQSDLLEVLCGIQPISSGSFTVFDEVFTPHSPATPHNLRKIGVAHIPEDRHRRGLVLPFQSMENAILGYHDQDIAGSGKLLDYKYMKNRHQEQMQRFDVRPPHPKLAAKNFSGGNQQKIVIARELDAEPKILLIGQPTRGVDIGAIEFIHNQILEFRARGCAILLVSVELDEILSLSDRIMVMNGGRQVGVIDKEEANEQRLGLLMAGIKEWRQAS